MKIGIKLEESNADGNNIAETIHKILDNKSYLENVLKIKAVTEGYDGINNTLDIIKSII